MRPAGGRDVGRAGLVVSLVLVLLAIAGTATAGAAPAAAATRPGVASSYTALGDSFSSGEGLPPYDAGSDAPADHCHRSAQAFPRLLSPPAGRFVACAGESSDALTTGHQTEPPQRGALDLRTTLVTLTFGGNELDWTGTLLACTRLQDEFLHQTVVPFDDPACRAALDATPARIAAMRARLVRLYADVLAAAPNARVRVLTYPPLFPVGRGPGDCRLGTLAPLELVIDAATGQRFGVLQQAANAAIRSAVTQVVTATPGGGRLRVVDAEAAFGGYGAGGHTVDCGDPGRPEPWIRSVAFTAAQPALLLDDVRRLDTGALTADAFRVYASSFHPTAEGQQQLARAVEASLVTPRPSRAS